MLILVECWVLIWDFKNMFYEQQNLPAFPRFTGVSVQLSNGSDLPNCDQLSKFILGYPNFKSSNPSFLQGVANAQIDNPSATHATTNNMTFIQNSFVNFTAIVSYNINKRILFTNKNNKLKKIKS